MELRLNPSCYLRYHYHQLCFQALNYAQASHGVQALSAPPVLSATSTEVSRVARDVKPNCTTGSPLKTF